MKMFICLALIAIAAADRLENTYLPPNSANTAGGNGHDLHAPSSTHYNYNTNQDLHNSPTSTGIDHQQSPEATAEILRFDNANNGDGSYKFEFETENKISQQEFGELKNVGTDQEASSVQGTYSYLGNDGILYTVNYIADENGFRATGDHLPTPPPVPELIQKSLEKIALQENSEASNRNGAEHNGYYNNENENTASKQYHVPNKSSYNQQTGYKY